MTERIQPNEKVVLPPLFEVATKLRQQYAQRDEAITGDGKIPLHFLKFVLHPSQLLNLANNLKRISQSAEIEMGLDFMVAEKVLGGGWSPFTPEEIGSANARVTTYLRLADYPKDTIEEIEWALLRRGVDVRRQAQQAATLEL